MFLLRLFMVAVAVRHEQPQESLRGGRPPQTATASSDPTHQDQNA